MSIRTKGSICGLLTAEESTYGKPTESTASLGGIVLTLKSPDAVSTSEETACGKRTRGNVVRIGQEAKWSSTFNVHSGQGTTAKWLSRALGGTSVQHTIPHFFALVNASVGATTPAWHGWTGSMVDKLTLSASELGGYVEYAVDAVARWHSLSTSLSTMPDADGTTLATVTPVAVESAPTVSFQSHWKYKMAGDASWTELKSNSWSISIGNSLQSYPDLSASANGFRLEAGQESVPQASEITVSVTFPSAEDSTWDARKLAYTTGMTLQLVLDGCTLTFTNCSLDPAGPDRKSDGPYDETLDFTATDLTVA